MVEGQIGLATQVGDVDRHPAARFEHSVSLLENPGQQTHMFIEAEVLVVLLADVVRRRCDHERHTIVGELIHVFRGLAVEGVEDPRRRGYRFTRRGWFDGRV